MKKFVLYAIFVFIQTSQGNELRKYEGHSLEEVDKMFQSEGLSYQIITEKQYLQFIETHKPDIKSNPLMEQAARDIRDIRKTPAERLDAVIKYLGL